MSAAYTATAGLYHRSRDLTRAHGSQRSLKEKVMNRAPNRFSIAAAGALLVATVSPARAQSFNPGDRPGTQGSSNVHLVSHIPLGRLFTVGNIDIEQELSRPYAYVSRYTRAADYGFDIIGLKEPSKARV